MNFHSINWLYAGVVAIAVLAIAYAWADKQRAKSLAEFASAKLLPELSRTVSPFKVFIKKLLFILGVLAVFVALARPQWGYRWEESKSRGIDVIFAIDTSKSMLAEDVKPNRLDRAKLSVIDLLNVLNGDRIGIVAFSGQAFLQCPLTLDYDAFRMSLEALDTNVIQRGGTNIAAAIEEAEVAFAKTSNKKVVVLISDGEELESSALERAKEAAKNDVIVYTLGVGGARGEAIPVRDSSGRVVQLRDENGKIVTSKLNEEVLSKIAEATGGFYEPLTANGMDTIYEEGLKKIPQHELSARMKQLAIERFQIPLAIAIILIALESLIGTRRFFIKKRNSIIPTILAVVTIPMFAIVPQESKAEDKATKNIVNAEQSALSSQDSPTTKESQETAKVVENIKKTKEMSAIETFNTALDSLKNGDKQNAKDLFAQSVKMSPENFSLHSKAFYNLGNIEYESAKYSLADANTSKEYLAKIAQADQMASNALTQGANLLRQGTPLLKQEQEALAKAKNDDEKKKALENSPLKNKEFQEQLKGGISACEAIEKEFEQSKKSTSENLEKWEEAKNILNSAIGNYKSALSLKPEFSDAKKNIESAFEAKKNLQAEIDSNKKIVDTLVSDVAKQKLENLVKMKEELKKLVRDDNNQNNQNQDNQQNQDQQQNQQQNNQNQQDKNNQQQNQNQQQNNKQEQNNEQNKNDQQKQESQNKQNNKQNKDKRDEQNNNDNRDEQAVKNQQEKSGEEQKKDHSQQTEKQEKQKEQVAENAVEQKEKASEKQAQSATEKGENTAEKERENFRTAVGAMTKGEAKQLLESMKDSDKILPLRGFGEQKDRFEKSYKDW